MVRNMTTFVKMTAKKNFKGASKKEKSRFLEVEKMFVDKKGQFLLNSNVYLSKKFASHFSQVFFKPKYWTEIRENQ